MAARVLSSLSGQAGEVSEWGYEYEEGEPVGSPLGYVEILNVATEEGQAGNTYDAVHFMLQEETCSGSCGAATAGSTSA